MSCPTSLSPVSQTNRCVLPSTGSEVDVNDGVSFGIYSDPNSDLYSVDFLSGAADQVNYTYKMLGGDVLDIELKPANIYSCYEQATLEYSYLVNIHQGKNVLSNILGNTTGSFDSDGNLQAGALKTELSGTHVALKYPKFDFAYARRVADGIAFEANIGGTEPVYSASFDTINGVQDYDLQAIVSASADQAGFDYSGKVGNKRIIIKKVFWKTPYAMWRFYGYYGGLNVVGNLSSYGQYADDSTFEVVPVWQNKAQAMAYEDSIYTRASHYSYEIKNNKLRLFPIPESHSPRKFWIQFAVPDDSYIEPSTIDTGIDGVNNLNTAPFGNIPFNNINSIGKQWIRRFALACAKGVLGQVRGKYSTVPIPGNEVTLNYTQLLEQSEKEKDALRDELKTVLDELTYNNLIENDAKLVDSTSRIQERVPLNIFVG